MNFDFRYSEGGRPACWLTSQNPSVEKLILVSTSAYALEREKRLFAKFRDITLWGDEKRRIFEDIYGFDGLSKNFNNWLNELATLKFFITPEVLQGIQCPTLILQGDRDVIVDHQHAVYLKKRIQNSKIWMFKTDHNILKNKHVDVNKKIHEFLFKDNQNSQENQNPVED